MSARDIMRAALVELCADVCRADCTQDIDDLTDAEMRAELRGWVADGFAVKEWRDIAMAALRQI